MKRTISHEANAAAKQLLTNGFTPACVPPSCGGLNPFTALGLHPAAGWPEIRQAFLARLRSYPPDRHPEEFVHIVDAYDTLKRSFREAAEREAAAAAQEGAGAEMATKRRRGPEAFGSASVAGGGTGCTELNTKIEAKQVIALDMTGVAHVGGLSGGCGTLHIGIAAPAVNGSSASGGLACFGALGAVPTAAPHGLARTAAVHGASANGYPSACAGAQVGAGAAPARIGAPGADGAAMCIG